MLNWLRDRSRLRAKAGEIYGAVVTIARSRRYYSDFSVPDTPEGRLEMIALVLFLVLERVKGIAPKGMDITQGSIEAFVTDMDDCLREMGVGDLTVPKKVKRAAAAFYERSGVYRAALSSSDEAGLAKAFVNYIYQGKDTPAALGLARLVAEQSRALAAAPDDNVLNAASLTAVMGSIAFGARSQTPNTNNESLA